MEQETNACSYTYSAAQHAEVRRIYDKYASGNEDKMAKLRRLDKSVTRVGTITAAAVGIVGALALCLGMDYFFRRSNFSMIGLLIALAGLAAVLAASPLYKAITARYRKKLSPEIITLCKELMD